MIDTLRLILFLKCNMKCGYCCNEKEEFSNQFVKKTWKEIHDSFPNYKNICVTGGEPFLDKELLYNVLTLIPKKKRIYIYTNGMFITNNDIQILKYIPNLKGINVGLHTKKQLNKINPLLEKELPVRFMVQDIFYSQMLELYPERLNMVNVKTWKLNDCNMPNEDWVLLKGKITK